MKTFFILLVLIVSLYCNSVVNSQDIVLSSFLNYFQKEYRAIRNVFSRIIGRNSEDSFNLARARSLNMLQEPVPLSVKFPCNITGFRSSVPPQSVDKVKPGDIDIVAALGDSLTAGNGLVSTNVLQVFVENRGLSWSIGGQGTWREYVTLPNILKEFNPNLFGFSLTDSLTSDNESQFNTAENAAFSSELPYMTKVLIQRIKADPRVDLQNHWKLITIMIGVNNFCLDMCYRSNSEDISYHQNHLLQSLRLLRDNLPRTIINLVPPPDRSKYSQLRPIPKYCEAIIRSFFCYCFMQPRFRTQSDKLSKIVTKWQRLEEEIADLPEFHTKDFTVVYQPFSLGLIVPKDANNNPDLSYLGNDCYHMSQKLNAEAANALWNNMLQKPGQKSKTNLRLFQEFLCPSQENPYIYTSN